MATIDELTIQVNALTTLVNNITSASKSISEFDAQSPIDDTSELAVSKGATPEKLTVRQIIDKTLEEALQTISTGWGYYDDSIISNQSFNTTPSKLTINGLSASTYEGELPVDIPGGGTLWDTVNNKITPANSGDSYGTRIDLRIETRTSNPTYAVLEFDIGGGATPTNVVLSRRFEVTGGVPFDISFTTDLFVRDTFKANGCQLFIKTDTGSVTISTRSILIKRDHKALPTI